MSSSALLRIDTSKITSFETLLAELSALDSQLGRHQLGNFQTFNTAYHVVTAAIKRAAEANYFANPEFIEEFSVCFAQYYFQAVNDAASTKRALPAAWAKMLPSAHRPALPAFILLLMGANAHINYDLPLALSKTMGRAKPDDLLRDILRVDRLLMSSGREIIGTFDEANKLVAFVKRRGQFLYYRPIMYMILYWRILAWRNYKAIEKNGVTHNRHATQSLKIANRLLRIDVYLG